MSRATPIGSLVEAATRGEQRAWEQLVDRFMPLVHSAIKRFQLDDAAAFDVSQTVWLRLVEHLPHVDEPSALPMWLIETTRRESLRVLRQRRSSTAVDAGDASGCTGLMEEELDDELLRVERQHALREGLAALEPVQRELLIMLIAEPPVPHREIARRLSMPVADVLPARARSLAALRHAYAVNASEAARVSSPFPAPFGPRVTDRG